MTDFTDLVDLAAERLGGAVLFCNDEFFAEKDNLLRAEAAVFIPGKYTDRGKWMDGWETRRRRVPGHDWCIVRLGVPGVVRGVVVDTSHFTGNYPSAFSLEACSAPAHATLDELEGARWVELHGKADLKGDTKNAFPVEVPWRATHVRLRIYPDGGVARLRVHGEVLPDPRWLGRPSVEQDVDLAAVEHGGVVVAASDNFYGPRHAVVMPGRAHDMSDGWETKRTRRDGPEWVVVRLAAEGVLHRIDIDTWRFRGNAPESAAVAVGASEEGPWIDVLPRTRLLPHTLHVFDTEIGSHPPSRYARLSTWPDGGVSRLRLIGVPSRAGRETLGVTRVNAMAPEEAAAAMLACCGCLAWARAMVEARPFRDVAHMKAEAQALFVRMTEREWLEAFAAHPRIGELRDELPPSRRHVSTWPGQEQSRVKHAPAETLAALAEVNRAYEARFGFVYLICATGLEADAMLADAQARLGKDRGAEMARASDEQRKITELRLEKLVRR
jgi:allantoicase